MVNVTSRLSFVLSLILAASLSIAAPVSFSDFRVRASERQPAQEPLLAHKVVEKEQSSAGSPSLDFSERSPITSANGIALGPVLVASIPPTTVLPSASTFTAGQIITAFVRAAATPSSVTSKTTAGTVTPSPSVVTTVPATTSLPVVTAVPAPSLPTITVTQTVTVSTAPTPPADGNPGANPGSPTPSPPVVTALPPNANTSEIANPAASTVTQTVTISSAPTQAPAVDHPGANPGSPPPVTFIVPPVAVGGPTPTPTQGGPTPTLGVPVNTSPFVSTPTGTVAAPPALFTITGLQKPAHVEGSFRFDISKRDGWSGRPSRIFGRNMKF